MMKRILTLSILALAAIFAPTVYSQSSGSTPPPPPYCTSANAGALYTNTGTSPATVYTCSYYNLVWQWVVNPSYGGLVSYPTVPATCSGSLPVFLAGWPNTQLYVCVNGVPMPEAIGPPGPVGPSGPPLNWRGNWAAYTPYARNDGFVEAGFGYVVITSYTSGATFGSLDTANSVQIATGCAGCVCQIPQGGTGAATAAQALINLGTEQIAQGGTGCTTAQCAAKAIVDGNATNPATIGATTPGTIIAAVTDMGGQDYNVLAYGAKGDGTTDDRAAIQAAINAANGGSIFLPGGHTYLLYNTTGQQYALRITQSGTSIHGVPTSVLKLADGQNSDLLRIADNVSNVEIYGFTIDGNNAQNADPEDGTHSCNNIRVGETNANAGSNTGVKNAVHNMWLKNAAVDSVLAYSAETTMDSNNSENPESAGFECAGSNNCIITNNRTTCTILGLTCQHAYELNNSSWSVVANNVAVGGAGYDAGLYDGVLVWTGSEFNTLVGNTILNAARKGLDVRGGEDTIIVGNHIESLVESNIDGTDFTVHGNEFVGHGAIITSGSTGQFSTADNAFTSGATLTDNSGNTMTRWHTPSLMVDGNSYLGQLEQQGNELFEQATNGSGSLYFNYHGYGGGYAQARNTYVGDGYGSLIAAFTGTSNNTQLYGDLQVGGTSTLAGTPTIKNQADAEIDATLWAGLTTSQKESFIFNDWNGNSQWYMVKDASNNWALNSATGGLDSFKAYQSTNSGDTYINASNTSGVVRVNYETGSGTGFNIYGGGSSSLYASFTGTTAIMFPGLAASSGHNCLQIDNSGYITNTGVACGTGSSNGTVNAGTSGQIAYYSATGTALSGISSVPVTAGGTGATTAAGALTNLGAVSTATTVNGHALSSNVVVSASDLTTGTLPHAQLPTLLSGDIPNNAANTTGNAATATYATSAGTATDPTKLPLTGGTLTGALNGTSASFSGNVVAGTTLPTTIGSSGVLLNGVPALQSQTSLNNYYSGGAGNLTGTGSYNTANGMYALNANTTGNNNTANGYAALYANTTGSSNTANGFEALNANTTGTSNTANGMYALQANTTGTSNTANGMYALQANTTGTSNTANGMYALQANTTGTSNTANGMYALKANTTGNYNSANGYQAGQFISDGSTANAASSSSVYLGANTEAKASGDTNENVIGTGAVGNGSNTTTLGNTATVGTWLNGTQHITATAPITSAGTIAAYSTNAGGEITGLSAATSVTITFANSGWTNAAFCTANASTTLATNVYNSIQSKTAVTFTFPALTGNLFYHCDGN
jgi:hypothetical protein